MAVIMLSASWFYMTGGHLHPHSRVGHGHVFDSSTFGLLGIAAFLLAETLEQTLICFNEVFLSTLRQHLAFYGVTVSRPS